MDIIQGKINSFKKELESLQESASSLKNSHSEEAKALENKVKDLISLRIYPFINGNDFLKSNYEQKTGYYHNLVKDEAFLSTVNNLMTTIKGLYELLNTDVAVILENNVKEHSGNNGVNRFYRGTIRTIFGNEANIGKNPGNIADFIEIISNETNYVELNPDGENTEEFINQFRFNRIFSVLEKLKSMASPEVFQSQEQKEFYEQHLKNMVNSEAEYQRLVEEYNQEFENLVDMVKTNADNENATVFNLFDKYSFFYREKFYGRTSERREAADLFLYKHNIYERDENGDLKLNHLKMLSPAMEVLSCLESDYIEAKNVSTRDTTGATSDKRLYLTLCGKPHDENNNNIIKINGKDIKLTPTEYYYLYKVASSLGKKCAYKHLAPSSSETAASENIRQNIKKINDKIKGHLPDNSKFLQNDKSKRQYFLNSNITVHGAG